MKYLDVRTTLRFNNFAFDCKYESLKGWHFNIIKDFKLSFLDTGWFLDDRMKVFS